MKNKISHKKLSLLLPHILIAGGLLTIPILIGYSNSYSLSSILYKLLFPLILLSFFYINYFVLIDKFLFTKKYILYSFFNICLLIGSFGIHKSNAFRELRDEHYRLERIELNKEGQILNEERIQRKDRVERNTVLRNGRLNNSRKKNAKKHRQRMSNRHSYGFMLFQFISILTAVGIKFGKRANFEESRRKDIEAAYLKSKHDLLRYQLQPHFFFNTLNSIHYLIDISTEKAQETLIDLSQLMRYVLNVTEKELVELEVELEFTKNYCELMRLRTADNLDFELNIERSAQPQKIAPLLIIVLIENAFKHGIGGRDSDFIHVDIVETNNSIRVVVQNSRYDQNITENADVSIGLENLKSRLDLVYPEKFKMEIKETLTSYETILILNS